jgi:hypothetical protein
MLDVEVASTRRRSRDQLPQSMEWLVAPQLPFKEAMVVLVEAYFQNVHNLRCFGFIHKPSYMQELDDERTRSKQDSDPLLLVLCALGAKFYVMNTAMPLPEGFGFRAGNQWATKAQNLVLTNLNNVCVSHTMAMVLLHEHELRVGNYASAFMLTGIVVRMAQALQINLESSTNIAGGPGELSWACKESRRRLMWGVYVMDAW